MIIHTFDSEADLSEASDRVGIEECFGQGAAQSAISRVRHLRHVLYTSSNACDKQEVNKRRRGEEKQGKTNEVS